MNHHKPLLTVIGLLIAPGAVAFGWTDPEVRQGPASGLAAGLSLRSSMDRTLVKAPGSQPSNPPKEWSRASFAVGPDYTYLAMFGALAVDVEIDAMSTGSDIIPNQDPSALSGTPNLSALGRWLGVVVSVKDGANGANAQSLIQRAKANGRSSGSDLFAYYFEESQGIHETLAGETLVTLTRESMGFDSMSGDDVDALDFALGVRAHAPLAVPDPMFPEIQGPPEFYFSVTTDSADDLNVASPSGFAIDSLLNPVPAHPGDLYVLRWNGLSWDGPFVYRSWSDLGLLAEEDVDAIAVDPGRENTVFSTVVLPSVIPGQGRSQLNYHNPLSGSNPLRDQSGMLTTERLGGGDDTTDIDAVCILDPVVEGMLSLYFGMVTGWLDLPGLTEPMGLSVTRVEPIGSGATTSQLNIQLSGRRGPALAPTIVAIVGTDDFDAAAGALGSTWTTVAGPVVRFDDGSEAANVLDFRVDIPDHVLPGSLAFAAVVLDLGGNIIGGSWVSEVRIR